MIELMLVGLYAVGVFWVFVFEVTEPPHGGRLYHVALSALWAFLWPVFLLWALAAELRGRG